MSDSHFFDTLCQKIRDAYLVLGHSLNWGFLYTPTTTLSKTQQLFFIGLNPGGGTEKGPYREEPSYEAGNAYLCDDWGFGEGKSPLQLQVQSLYFQITSQLKENIDYKRLMNQSLAANYVPFQSPNWKALPNKRQTLNFADNLWSDVLDLVIPSAIVSIAEIPYRHFVKLLQSKGFNIRYKTRERIGWGKVTFSMAELELNTKSIVVVRLPHLSRYKIFNREQCLPAIGIFTSKIASIMNQKVF